MRILGIDPGLNVTGLGVIDAQAGRCLHVHHSVLRTRPSDGLAARLLHIRDGVRDVIASLEVRSVSVESSFVSNNARSALLLGHARAAAILGAADSGLEIYEYTPATVKQTVAGYGMAEKSQVAKMVALQLELRTLPAPYDAADALAIAIAHWAHARLETPALSRI